MSSRRATHKTQFVSFSGIDGAGKTTQIDALYASMRRSGLRVRLIRFWDDIALFTGIRESAGHKLFKGDKGVGRPDAPINRRDKNVQSAPMSCLRLFLYFVDAISVRNVIRKMRSSDIDLVIFDRYIYDELANLKLDNLFIRCYVRLMMKFVPEPHIGFLLDADPAQARARKPEYPLDFLYVSRQSYLDLCALIGGITIVSPASLEDATREVLTRAMSKLTFDANAGKQHEE